MRAMEAVALYGLRGHVNRTLARAASAVRVLREIREDTAHLAWCLVDGATIRLRRHLPDLYDPLCPNVDEVCMDTLGMCASCEKDLEEAIRITSSIGDPRAEATLAQLGEARDILGSLAALGRMLTRGAHRDPLKGE